MRPLRQRGDGRCWVERWRQGVLQASPPRVGGVRAACQRAGALYEANPARAAGWGQPAGDGAARSCGSWCAVR
jgi:hypothetical protein